MAMKFAVPVGIIIAILLVHGVITQTPNDHLQALNFKSCHESSPERSAHLVLEDAIFHIPEQSSDFVYKRSRNGRSRLCTSTSVKNKARH